MIVHIAIGYVFSFAIALLFGIYVSRKNVDEKKIMRFLALACTAMAVFILIQPIAPDLVKLFDIKFILILGIVVILSTGIFSLLYSHTFIRYVQKGMFTR